MRPPILIFSEQIGADFFLMIHFVFDIALMFEDMSNNCDCKISLPYNMYGISEFGNSWNS